MSVSVIHYEVHVFERGRWHVHARYAREERDRAMNDARNTEFSTGHATKVVRDVFYPDTGTNQEQTIYLSPRMQRVQPRALADRQIQAVQGLTARRHARERARQRSMFRSRSPFVRIALAVGFSLAASSVVATVLSWAFRNAPGTVSAESLTRMLLTAYLATFVLTFMSLMWGVGHKQRKARRAQPPVIYIPTPVTRRQQQILPYRQIVQDALQRIRLIRRRHRQLNV